MSVEPPSDKTTLFNKSTGGVQTAACRNLR